MQIFKKFSTVTLVIKKSLSRVIKYLSDFVRFLKIFGKFEPYWRLKIFKMYQSIFAKILNFLVV